MATLLTDNFKLQQLSRYVIYMVQNSVAHLAVDHQNTLWELQRNESTINMSLEENTRKVWII